MKAIICLLILVILAGPAWCANGDDEANTEKQDEKGEDVQYCPKCGAENPIDANFCVECGYPLKAEVEKDKKNWTAILALGIASVVGFVGLMILLHKVND